MLGGILANLGRKIDLKYAQICQDPLEDRAHNASPDRLAGLRGAALRHEWGREGEDGRKRRGMEGEKGGEWRK